MRATIGRLLTAALLLSAAVLTAACASEGDSRPTSEGGTTEPVQREPVQIDNYGLIDYTAGEGLLYNGIRRPEEWPPKSVDPNTYNDYKIPYLLPEKNGGYRPEVIDITVGRQLFVDKFLIAETDLETVYHHPEKYEGNPILKPETKQELQGEWAATLSAGGVWYDMIDNKYKMWYDVAFNPMLGYAESDDGIHWERVPVNEEGTNIVMGPDLKNGTCSVFIDYAADPSERYKMLMQSFNNHYQNGENGHFTIAGSNDENNYAHTLYVSADGKEWRQVGGESEGLSGDMTGAIYNVFTGEWINSLRSYAVTNYYGTPFNGRVRYYAAHQNFGDLLHWDQEDVVFWLKCDGKDAKDPDIGMAPQAYNFNAIGYESIMVGLFQIWRGPENHEVISSGNPKITELIAAYSRDGFYYDRPDRTAFIRAEREDGNWDKGYLFCAPGSMIVKEDEIWFYYGGFSGFRGNLKGGHSNGAIGLAILRRDGFASLEGKGEMLTRTLTTNGDKKHLFVNLDAPAESFRAELLDADGNVIKGFSMEDCIPVGGDDTCRMLTWKGGNDVSFLNGSEFSIRFSMEEEGKFYAFWLSDGTDGNSGGAVGAGYAGRN